MRDTLAFVQAQLGMSSAWLEPGNLTNALREADGFLESALSTDDPNLQTLAWEMKARIAIAKGECLRIRRLRVAAACKQFVA